jgi:hypothetical protein
VVTSLDFCSDRLVSASKDGTCKVWILIQPKRCEH